MLQINDLKVSYFKEAKEIKAVDGVRLKIPKGSIFAVVGESGCGKTTLGLSLTDLIDPSDGRIMSGAVVFEGRNILRLGPKDLCNIRGKDISYIFQEPASSHNPVFTIGEQITETLLVHKMAKKDNVKDKALISLREAGLAEAERVFNSFPHELSGGMKQRAMIAMAVSTRPKLLVADEPTTALDVNTESRILELLLLLRDNLGLSVLFITHNMRIVKRIADEVAVMYQGKVVEVGNAKRVLSRPRHLYTQLLLDSIPERLKL